MLNEFFKIIRRDNRGTTAVEYAAIAGVIALGIIAAVGAVGSGLGAMLMNVANGFN